VDRCLALASELKVAREAARGAGATPPFWDRLDAISVPTLLLAGAEDERYVAYARRLARAIPQAQVEIVAGSGHAVHLEQPEATARLLVHHLSRR